MKVTPKPTWFIAGVVIGVLAAGMIDAGWRLASWRRVEATIVDVTDMCTLSWERQSKSAKFVDVPCANRAALARAKYDGFERYADFSVVNVVYPLMQGTVGKSTLIIDNKSVRSRKIDPKEARHSSIKPGDRVWVAHSRWDNFMVELQSDTESRFKWRSIWFLCAAGFTFIFAAGFSARREEEMNTRDGVSGG